jgi:hypothetical protein
VPESRRHGLHARATGEIERGADVSQIMQTHPRHTGPSDARLEGSAHVTWRKCRPNSSSKHEARFLPVSRSEFSLGLADLVRIQRGRRVSCEPHRA